MVRLGLGGDREPHRRPGDRRGRSSTKAGYKKDSAGFYALNGKEVSLTIVDPASYTDYAQDDQIIAQELQGRRHQRHVLRPHGQRLER